MKTRFTEQARVATEERRHTLIPAHPRTIDETGLSFQFLVELLTKALFLRGQMRLMDLVSYSKLSVAVLEPLLAFMRTERMCEATRSSEAETAIAYNLTELGRLRAEDYLRKSQYVGPAPVSLPAYVKQVREQSVANMQVTREQLSKVFNGLVVKEGILKQFGAAMNSGRAIFVYGPAGSGKTFIAEHLAGLLSGDVAIPHAIVVDNEVIQVFDPLTHEPCVPVNGSGNETALGLDRRMTTDARWVACHRPVIKTGGELTLAMLDLDFDESARFYQAPPQVKANNGLLIIDDLGRQLAPAIDIMNRWIVPLDRHVDYLALHTGKKFMLPFDVIVVFSTNLPPSKLADEAFLRRLGYKIYVGPLSEDEYRQIAKQVCTELQIPFSEEGFNYLLHEHHYKSGKPLSACIPRDILEQLRDIARYEGKSAEMSRELLDWAWNNYFTHD
ncbi:MAG: ATP-binding protein [Methylotenera sp.]|nr:ATP-binding protein [Methylotenera sp.]MDO9232514.1 ATP-binding protein [Methylotenera sp.]MDO9388753.1 ATP-binding protein [Methylotenera sp.]MDP2403535.1 ATP-binding protein [Methylotenera sp.]MDP3095640.1 ATP-binding protein [Methylotenera sp.]